MRTAFLALAGIAGVLAAITAGIMQAKAADAPTVPYRPAQTAPVPHPVLAWPASIPAQTGQTCLGTASDAVLNAYGLNVPLSQYKTQLYVKGWEDNWAADNDRLLDGYLSQIGLTTDPVGQLSPAALYNDARSGRPILASVMTSKLPWWKVSEVQGSHEIVIDSLQPNGYLQVWDPAWGKYFTTKAAVIANASFRYDAIVPSIGR